MRKLIFLGFLASLACFARADTTPKQALLGDSAIRRVEDCTCYASIEAQGLKPWEFAWQDPEKLRTQITHCICTAQIDVSQVANPQRYVVPGTRIK